MEAVLVQIGGVKSLPEFQRSKEQGVCLGYGLGRFPGEFSPDSVADEGF